MIPSNTSEMEGLIRLWEREAALTSSALYVDAESVDTGEKRNEAVVRRFPDLRLAVDEAELPWKHGMLVRGLLALPVAWGP